MSALNNESRGDGRALCGRPGWPVKLHTDKGYDFRRRQACLRCGAIRGEIMHGERFDAMSNHAL